MRTKEVKLFKLSELSPSARERAIGSLSDINVDYDWWQDDGLIDLSKQEVNSRHLQKDYKDLLFSWSKIYFDIDRGSYLQFIDLVVSDNNVFRKFLRIPKSLWENVYFRFENSSGNWNQSNTKIVFENQYNNRDFTSKQQSILDRATSIFDDKISEGLSNLKQQYEFFTSEEQIIETIEANSYEFTEEGELDS
jgi:hypothetical protein